jgi:hypothetical protein
MINERVCLILRRMRQVMCIVAVRGTGRAVEILDVEDFAGYACAARVLDSFQTALAVNLE